jgi:hypothetical protein
MGSRVTRAKMHTGSGKTAYSAIFISVSRGKVKLEKGEGGYGLRVASCGLANRLMRIWSSDILAAPRHDGIYETHGTYEACILDGGYAMPNAELRTVNSPRATRNPQLVTK